ncbi:MAG: methyltransferase domain-containing protein [Candidatus Microsaccharimonas sp.]
MHIALLGRQPALSIAELERTYPRVSWFSADTALVDTPEMNIQKLGGTQKAGKVAFEVSVGDWRRVSDAIVAHYSKKWGSYEGKITLGLSAYGVDVSVRELQKVGLILKGKLKGKGASIRLIPNQEVALSSATSHHNKLGLSDNKVELLIIKGGKTIIVAESTGAQNITALAARDQGRPKRDAFVGMLPPKLAQIMINLAGEITKDPESDLLKPRILDPFCGTGVLLQEASLMGYAVYGTDIAEKMIRYSRDNLNWLQDTYRFTTEWYLHEGDAIEANWQQPVDAVVSEAYLGQPFSAPPSSAKLTEVRGNCNHIISGFLRNLANQLKPGTPVVLAVPAWKDKEGRFTHLPLIDKLSDLGFEQVKFETVPTEQLLYHRPDQVVARELLVLTKS